VAGTALGVAGTAAVTAAASVVGEEAGATGGEGAPKPVAGVRRGSRGAGGASTRFGAGAGAVGAPTGAGELWAPTEARAGVGDAGAASVGAERSPAPSRSAESGPTTPNGSQTRATVP